MIDQVLRTKSKNNHLNNYKKIQLKYINIHFSNFFKKKKIQIQNINANKKQIPTQ